MSKYRVQFVAVAEISIEIDAEDREEAIEKAYDTAPNGVCAQCSGWGKDWEMSLSQPELADTEFTVQALKDDELVQQIG